MRYLLTLFSILWGSCTFAQTFSITARLGVSPQEKPNFAKDLQNAESTMAWLVGIRLGLATNNTDIGLGIDHSVLLYKYSAGAPPEGRNVKTENPFYNPNITLNYKTRPSGSFFYGGAQAGMLLPTMGKSMLFTIRPVGGRDNDQPSKLGLGLTVGGQIGGQLKIARRFSIVLEGALRYAKIKTATHLDRTHLNGQQSLIEVQKKNVSFLYYPITMGFKYDF